MADIALGALGVALTLPGLIQSCLHYHQFLSSILRSIRDSDSQIQQFALYFEITFAGLQETLTAVSKCESALDPPTRDIILRVLQEVHTLMIKLATKLQTCVNQNDSPLGKMRYSLSLKSDLARIQKEIDTWNDRLIRRLLFRGFSLSLEDTRDEGVSTVDNSIIHPQTESDAKATLLAVSELPLRESLRRIEHTQMFVGRLPLSETYVLLEFRHYEPSASFGERMFVKHSTRGVADMLCSATPKMATRRRRVCQGILECVGYFSQEDLCRYGIVSQLPFPPNLDIDCSKNPRSLMSLLCGVGNKRELRHDLGDRISLATSIASALLEIHAAKFVHKSIRPSNILIFDPVEPGTRGYPYHIGQSAIVGFEETRPDDEDSARLGSIAWEDNIYRHPQRQGLIHHHSYSIRHDIYSLGVVLLEIALWRSSIAFIADSDGALTVPTHNKDFWGTLYDTRCKEGDPEKIAMLYRKLARATVPKLVGGRFAGVIESCLTGFAIDQGSDKDDSRAAISVAYIERVIEVLESICL